MWTQFKQWLTPPVFEGEQDRTRIANLLNTILIAVFAITSLLTILTALLSDVNPLSLGVGAAMALVSLIMLFVMRRGHVRAAALALISTLWINVTIAVYLTGTIRAPLVTVYLLTVVIASLLLNTLAVIIFNVLSIAVLFILFEFELSGLLPPAATSTSFGNWLVYAASFSMSAVLLQLANRSISRALERSREYAADLEIQQERLVEQSDYLETTVRQLEQNARYLEATAQVSREVSLVLEDPQRLLARVVDLISAQFGFYHAGIFLLDATGRWAELQAASSEGGQQMLARAHRLEIGALNMVGDAISRGEPRLVLDVGAEAQSLDIPDLPDTHSVLVLPLEVRGEIIGALDVHSRELAAFRDEDITTLQSLADQVAVAINNARLVSQLEQSLAAEQRAYGQMTRESWRDLARVQANLNVLSEEDGVTSAQAWWPEMHEAYEKGRTIQGGEGDKALALPIQVRGEIVGVLDGRKPDGSTWSPEEVALMETLTEQVSVALESARLYQDTQLRAAREQTLSQAGGRMRESLQLQEVLQVAVSEMREALGLERVVIQLATEDQDK